MVEKIYDMDKDRISYHLHMDGLESILNAGADELAIGEVSPEDLKAHMAEVQDEESEFGAFMYVYNILMRIHQKITR